MSALPQERRIVTAIPGPKSQELQARRTAAVAQGVGSVLPVVTARAGGGIIEDVDGNRLIDFGYHGRTNLTMALTAKNMPYKHGFGPFAPEVYRVPVAYGYRWPTGPENAGPEAAAQAIDQISKQVGPDNVAAIIIEPVLGEGGFIEPAKGFLPAIRKFAADNGIVFVADEIQSGFCRTGQWFACEDEGIVPDLITTAKGIAGGLPLAAVTGRAEIMDAAHAGGLGGTYGGNPVACAGALGSIETMK